MSIVLSNLQNRWRGRNRTANEAICMRAVFLSFTATCLAWALRWFVVGGVTGRFTVTCGLIELTLACSAPFAILILSNSIIRFDVAIFTNVQHSSFWKRTSSLASSAIIPPSLGLPLAAPRRPRPFNFPRQKKSKA